MPGVKTEPNTNQTETLIAEQADSVISLKWAIPVGIIVTTFLSFLPALRNGFVNWDDNVNILQNTAFRGMGAEQLEWMFTTLFGGHYQPLTWLSFAADYQVWGLQPFGYHLTNLVLHTIGAVLFFFVALQLLQWAFGEDKLPSQSARYWCAALAAAIFALHPLRVESVAWVTERRDVLSGVFFFACLLAYFKAVGGKEFRAGCYLLAVLLFAGSLLSKATAMTLPAVLLVIDVYPCMRLRRKIATVPRLLGEKIPFLILSVAAAWVAVGAQRAAGAMRSLEESDVLSRLATICYGYCFYVWKLFVPNDLSPLYRIPEREKLLGLTFIITVTLLALAVIVSIALWKKFPAFLAVFACYVLILSPVSGIAQSGKQLVADRYSYLALLPFAILIAGALLRMYSRPRESEERKKTVKVFTVLACLCVLGLSPLTFAQTMVWTNSVTLWDQAAGVDPDSSVALVNLGEALFESKNYRAAGIAFLRARELDKDDAKAHNGLGISLLQLEQYDESLKSLKEAVRLAPGNPKYRCNLGYTLSGFNLLEEAATEYSKALAVAPGMSHASIKLAELLVRLKRYEQAKEVLIRGEVQNPQNRVIRGNLAWLLATCPADGIREGEVARKLAEGLARETENRDPWVLDTLAAALAEVGDFQEAVEISHAAFTIADELGKVELGESIRRRHKLYQSKQPFRDE